MELALKTLKVDISNDVILQIKEKTQRVFSRVNDNIMAIKLTLKDVNGPKGGNDKQCTIVVHCHGMPSIVASNNQQSIVVAVNLALAKAHASLMKRVKRIQHNRPKLKALEEDEEILKLREECLSNSLS